jgi:hypothetical protein
MIKIATCNCVHTFQDKRYGKNKRVHNKSTKKNLYPKRHRCTVCLNEKDI